MIIGNHEQTSLSASRNIEATVQERHYPHILLHRRTVSMRKLKMHTRDPIHVRPNEHYIRWLVLDPAERIRVPGPLGYTKATRLQKLYAARLH